MDHSHERKGVFITFEGSEGCGKTRQVAELDKYLQQQGYPVLVIREPGGTTIGDQIRGILLDFKNAEMCFRTETLLFQASRAQLVDQVILPYLHEGGVILGDRYADSTLAYQGYGRQLDLEQVKSLVAFATGGLKPDLTMLLDVDVEVGLQRRAGGGGWNRLDNQALAFYKRVRQGYLNLAQADPERWAIIDAGQPLEQVQAAIQQVVMHKLGEKGIAPTPNRSSSG
ncbi:MAG: dTMP kinase [Anaerolineales bacterium]|nr:dTMP kinase [Anaerolineales bacterium]